MATDKTGTWSFGESQLWYSPTSGLDTTWSFGESYLVDEYEAPAGGFNPAWAVRQTRTIGGGVSVST